MLKGTPQKKQLEFFNARTKYVAYGGARGGGKSWALRRKIVLMCARYEGLKVLLVRRTYAELLDNHIRPLMLEIGDAVRYSDSKKTFEFPNGSLIRMGYLRNESDAMQYQGQEYDVIAIDEATQMTEYQFQALKGCLRGTNDYPKRMYLTCNPGGVGHGWVKRLFIDREYRESENGAEYTFIKATVYDNGVLLGSNPDYVKQLESLPHGLREAWLSGDWSSFEGQFFREFDYDVHTVPPFCVDEGYRKYCAMDYGLDMLAVVFVAVGRDGRAYVYDEIHQSGLIVSEAARLIKQKMQGIDTVIAPSDLWSRQKDSGKSIAELFSENGVYLTKLTTERTQGWACLKEWLSLRDDGVSAQPRMKIMRCCTNLIRCLPLLMSDPTRPGDVSIHPHSITHAPDALRYFAVWRSSAPGEKKAAETKKLYGKGRKINKAK